MRTADEKREFIRLRAEGKSYRAIEAELGISRTTCGKWERELSADIARLKQESLEEIYTQYGMAKEARIRRIGDTLRRIDEALADVDLSALPPEKLLDYKLKYSAALRDEYIATASTDTTGSAKDTLEAVQGLYRRISTGETSTEQAKLELKVIDQIRGGYDRKNPFDFSGL